MSCKKAISRLVQREPWGYSGLMYPAVEMVIPTQGVLAHNTIPSVHLSMLKERNLMKRELKLATLFNFFAKICVIDF